MVGEHGTNSRTTGRPQRQAVHTERPTSESWLVRAVSARGHSCVLVWPVASLHVNENYVQAMKVVNGDGNCKAVTPTNMKGDSHYLPGRQSLRSILVNFLRQSFSFR
jgi:hypothetical protein